MTVLDEIGPIARVAYEEMAPVHAEDAIRGYPLALFLHAYYMPLQKVDDIVRDRPELNLPGWGILFHPDLCPAEYLGYLAMFAGVPITDDMSEAEKRQRIKLRDNTKRCTPGAIIQAAQDHLIEPKRVILRERYDPDNPLVDSPGHFMVITYTADTPDPDAVLAAIKEQKDVGLILHYDVQDGQDWQQVVTDYATWNDVLAAYDTWQDLIDDTP